MFSPGESESENLLEENFIDSGIKDISSLRFKSNITTLNLHYNSITTIKGLNNLCNLKHLDISSNLLTKICGLESLICLRTLNLSSNRIKKLEGLSKLRQLVKLNVSYNEISDISGLNEFINISDHPLTVIEMQANRIKLISHVIKSCQKLNNLRQLTLHDNNESSNPLCDTPDYRNKIFGSLPQLRVLDGKDRTGKRIEISVLADIPGLEQFMEYLSSSTERFSEITPQENDRQFPEKTILNEKKVNTFHLNQRVEIEKDSDNSQEELKLRLKDLENKLTSFMTKNENQTPNTVKKDGDKTGNIKDAGITSKPNLTKERKENHDSKMAKLIKELDQERYKRIDIENKLQFVVTKFKDLQLTIINDKKSKEDAIKSTEKLTEAFSREKTLRQELEKKAFELQSQINEQETENLGLKQKLESFLSETRRKLEMKENQLISKSEEIVKMAKELEERKLGQQVAETNVASIKKLCSNLEGQVDDLQSTLSRREKEYQMTLASRYALDSKELKDYVEKQVKAARTESLPEIKAWKNKLDESNNQYKDLENEFRLALHMEADRYNKLENSYLQVVSECNSLKNKSEILIKKDEESKSLISELTAVVKDQKSKLIELSKSKQENNRSNKERILTLEAHVEEARRQMLQFELTKQENKKLQAKLSAQESVLEGLRTERKLWSEELAQQGYLLTQDRAKLECKIDSQASEISSLKMELEKEAENLKMKCKIIEDQTAMILKLKDGLAERNMEVKTITEKILEDQKAMETRVQDLLKDNSHLQETVSKLNKRKEELKDMIVELQDKLEESEAAQELVNQKWKNKSELIAKLENQVVQMQNYWEKKTSELIEERNGAQDKAKSLESDLESVEHNLKLQLEMAHKNRDFIRQEADERVAAVEEEMRRLLLETDGEKKKLNSRLKILNKAIQELDSDRGNRF